MSMISSYMTFLRKPQNSKSVITLCYLDRLLLTGKRMQRYEPFNNLQIFTPFFYRFLQKKIKKFSFLKNIDTIPLVRILNI